MMDFEDLQKFAVANFSQYFSVIVDTLTRPSLHFAPIAVTASGQETGVPMTRVGTQLNPQLVGFAVLSMFLGLTMNSLITKQPSGQKLFVIEIVGLLFWVLYAALVHLFCRLARGRGSFSETVSVTIQIFATLYVVCSVVATTLAMILMLHPINLFVSRLGVLGEMVAYNPVVLFFVIHTILLVIYLPRGLKLVHGFNVLQQIAVALPTGLVVLLHGIAMIFLTGTLWEVDPAVSSSARKPVTHVARDMEPIVVPILRCAEERPGAALVHYSAVVYRETCDFSGQSDL
jgi:uncharacterized protein YhhL (DUF1145 family)